MRVIAILESMWDWRAQTSGAGYKQAPRYFRINPNNHSGRRLYSLLDKGDKLLVTESCRELVSSANEHGTPDPEWLAENLKILEDKTAFNVLLVCGKVAQATYGRCGYTPPIARVLEIPHPAARLWSHARIAEVRGKIAEAQYANQTLQPNSD